VSIPFSILGAGTISSILGAHLARAGHADVARLRCGPAARQDTARLRSNAPVEALRKLLKERQDGSRDPLWGLEDARVTYTAQLREGGSGDILGHSNRHARRNDAIE
jgi:hypothetical protein